MRTAIVVILTALIAGLGLSVLMTWAGNRSITQNMTYDRIKITAPNLTSVSVIRRTVRQGWSMEADGTLVIESLIVADPLPWGQEAPSPTPVRRTYKKG